MENVRDNYYLVTAIGALVLLAVAFDRVFEYSKLTIRMTMGAYNAINMIKQNIDIYH